MNPTDRLCVPGCRPVTAIVYRQHASIPLGLNYSV